MTFRQNEIFVMQFGFFSCLLIVLTAVLSILAGEIQWMAQLCSVAIALVFLYTLRTEPLITMDERGVRCFREKEVLWDLPWAEIAEVRRITHLRSRAILIVPIEEQKREFEALNGGGNLCIQLTKTSKRALNTYCPGLRT